MNAYYFGNIQNNKLFFIILLVLLSLLSVYMPHGVIETHEHQDFKSLFKQVANNLRPLTNLRKFLKKIKTYILRINKRLSTIAEKINTRFDLFNLLFFKVSILQLYSFLYCYFHTSKYKEASC
jgi:hypothetical protein